MTRALRAGALALGACLSVAAAGGPTGSSIHQRPPKPVPTPGPMLEQGTLTLDTPDFELTLVRSSQTVAALKSKRAGGFDFTPGDLLVERSRNGYYHLGDLDLRVRVGTAGAWKSYSTARSRTAVTVLPASQPLLAAADLSPTLPPDLPVRVTREWRVENGALVLRFVLTNHSAEPVEVGSLGIPMVFNNILSGRSLDQAHAACVFSDPYLGLDAGYLQVTRLNGKGPALLVVPDGRTPFEAYSPILNPPRPPGSPAAGPQPVPAEPPPFTDPTPRGVTFEGFFDWMVHSQAHAESEWKNVDQWNPPTRRTVAPGASVSYGVAFVEAADIRAIERALAARSRPVAVGLPGYVVPADAEARLFLKYQSAIASMRVDPAAALTATKQAPTPGGWKAYSLRGTTPGRARLTITYADGVVQTIHYLVTKPPSEAVDDMGRFMTTRQWFVDPADPFKRSPSVMTYDRDENRIVTEDSRVWIAGLGDEGGSSWLAGALKQLGRPVAAELAKYQQFIDGVVWGGLQYGDGPRQYAVRKSLFYYQPDQMPPGYYRGDLNWTTWTSWKKDATEAVDRSYNYPHVAALHWTMYRLARNHVGLVTNHQWDWYLDKAYRTSVAMVVHAPRYAQFGQMEGTVFVEILRDLQREGWKDQAADLEARMKARTAVWTKLAYPFGSEMPWDSTGQEEVYAWTTYFGDLAKARVTLDAIVAYMPTVPHWAYNGSARRYWDFQYAGKVRRVERQLHHYGSGLNAIPVLAGYREHPEDLHLLRVGFAGAMGALTNIDADGFLAPAFHSFPDMLRRDAISGDCAQNFLGHAFNTGTYVVHDPEFGWQAFGGVVSARGSRVVVEPRDSFRMRVYLAPLGLWITLDAGHFERVEFDVAARTVRLSLAPATGVTPVARVRVEQPAAVAGVGTFAPRAAGLKSERGAYIVPLGATTTVLDVSSGRGRSR
ncbi:MAG TPA: DUF5695 domain-containing protein [Vicinamibacterales bacterium]|jgi:hypothetical protein